MNRAKLLATVLTRPGGGEPASPLLDDLVAYWNLDESSNGSAPVARADSVAGLSLTDNNTVPSATGLLGNAISLDGTVNEYVYHADEALLSVGDRDFTLAAWANPTNFTGGGKPVVGKMGDASNVEYCLRFAQTTGNLELIYSADGANILSRSTDNAGSTAAWNLCLFWYDAAANTVNVQLNNSTVASASLSGGVFNGNSQFVLGKQVYGNLRLTGLVDEVGVWARVLTSDERTSLWNGGAGVTHPF